jgi:hypothetical protein
VAGDAAGRWWAVRWGLEGEDVVHE